MAEVNHELDVIAEHLAAKGFGIVAETIWTFGTPAETAYPALAVAPYGGDPIETFSRAEQQHRVQVFITADVDDISGGWLLANRAWSVLANESMDLSYGGIKISTIRPVGVVNYLGKSGNNRPMFSINLEMTK